MSYPKETVEVVEGLLELAAVLAVQFKDGVQVADIGPILAKLQTEPCATALKEAYNGIDKVPAEIKEVKVVDAVALIAQLTPKIMALVQAVQK
jgi:hypothetical protein